MTTPYELHGGTLKHRDGPAGGPTFEIDWEKRTVRHEGEVVPGSGSEKRVVHEEKLEVKGTASAKAPGLDKM